MSLTNPIPRGTREVTLLTTSGQTVFGPFEFVLFDPADLQLWATQPGDDLPIRLNTNSYTVTPAAPAIAWPARFGVTLNAALTSGTSLTVRGARIPERSTDVTRGGVVRSVSLETEFDKAVAAMQELRRDINRATPGDAQSRRLRNLADPRDPQDAVTRAFMDTYALNRRVDPTAFDATGLRIRRVANPTQDSDAIPKSWLDAHLSLLGANVHPALITDYASAVAVTLATITDPTVLYLRTAGFTAPGLGGAGLYKRVISLPTYGGLQTANGVNFELVFGGAVAASQFGFGPLASAADNSTALNAAFAFIAARGGGYVDLPSGAINIIANIRAKAARFTLRGADGGTQLIVQGSGDTIDAHADDYSELFFLRIERITFDETAKTGGNWLNVERAGQVSFQRCYVKSPWNGIRAHNINNLNLEDLQIETGRGTYHARVTGGGTADIARYGQELRTDVVRFTNFRSSGSAGDDIVIDGFVASVDILGCHSVAPLGRSLHVKNTIGATQVNEFIQGINFNSDSPKLEGVRLDVGRRQHFYAPQLFGSKEASNFYIANGIQQAKIIGGASRGARLHGVHDAGRSTQIVGLNASENSSENNPLGGVNHGLTSGIYLAATSRKATIVANRCGDPDSSNWQKAGIEAAAGADNFTVVLNDCEDNVAGTINNAGVSNTRVMHTNRGSNDVYRSQYANYAGTVESRLVNSATGPSVAVIYSWETGTPYSFLQGKLIDNTGAPYFQWSYGGAVTRVLHDAPRHTFRSTGGATIFEVLDIGVLQFPVLATDPASPQNGWVWLNTTDRTIRCSMGGTTYKAALVAV